MRKNIVRVNKNKNYTVMSNYHLKDKNLSWKAKGIHSYVLSLPDDWKIIIEHLKTISTDGRDSTRSGIQELYNLRYWQRYPVHVNGKIEKWVTEIYEEPFAENNKIKNITYKDGIKTINYANRPVDNLNVTKEKPLTDNPQVVENTTSHLLTGNPQVGKPQVGNPELLSTNNTKDLFITNHSINQQEEKKQNERLNDLENLKIKLKEKYGQAILEKSLQQLSIAIKKGTVVNNLYNYLDKVCNGIQAQLDITSGINSVEANKGLRATTTVNTRKGGWGSSNIQTAAKYTDAQLEEKMLEKRNRYCKR